MPQNKYISTKDAARLTGLSIPEIYDLIHSGKLPARKAPKNGWRISPSDLSTLGLIQEKENTTFEASQIENYVSYVADDEHYTLVFNLIEDNKAYV